MSNISGLRHFSHGISMVSQWTGSEHKEMEKVFLGLVMGAVDQQIICAVRAVIDFIYLASLQSHTSHTLSLLRQALDDFHTHKDAFIELGARTQGHFNIPKIHAMEHYVAMIEKFGSADGFNTESPERLHIDYAKDAYRASNRKDYLLQMVVWLRRQEATDRFTIYLDWCRNRGSSPEVHSAHVTPEHEADDAAEAITAVNMAVQAGSSQLRAAALLVRYNVPTRHPATLRGIPAADIIERQGASQFLPSIQAFLRLRNIAYTPRLFDGFDIYPRLALFLPPIAGAGHGHHKNVVRATPPIPAHERTAAQPARLDFALVRTAEINQRTAGTPLEGLRVAHVRVIFALAHHYPLHTDQPLVYVEWFTPFGRVDASSGLHVVSPSSRMHRPYGEVITIDRIVRNCHLLPSFGKAVDSRWTVQTVTEECRSFYVNPYIDIHSFCMFRAHFYGCA